MFIHFINCPHCGLEITENWAQYVVSSDVIDGDRGMGAEVEHSVECDNYECPHCHKSFSVSGSVWEYPEGMYNDHELHTSVN